jgi:hypothetical protein
LVRGIPSGLLNSQGFTLENFSFSNTGQNKTKKQHPKSTDLFFGSGSFKKKFRQRKTDPEKEIKRKISPNNLFNKNI